jgi:hypothetical protein
MMSSKSEQMSGWVFAAIVAVIAFFTNPGTDGVENLLSINKQIMLGENVPAEVRAIAGSLSVRADDKIFFTRYTLSLPIYGDVGRCYGAFNYVNWFCGDIDW